MKSILLFAGVILTLLVSVEPVAAQTANCQPKDCEKVCSRMASATSTPGIPAIAASAVAGQAEESGPSGPVEPLPCRKETGVTRTTGAARDCCGICCSPECCTGAAGSAKAERPEESLNKVAKVGTKAGGL